MQLEKTSGRTPVKLLEEPEIPDILQHVHDWYQDLSSSRGGGFGPSPIDYGEIADWARLTGTDPSPWVVETIRALDRVYFRVQRDKAKK